LTGHLNPQAEISDIRMPSRVSVLTGQSFSGRHLARSFRFLRYSALAVVPDRFRCPSRRQTPLAGLSLLDTRISHRAFCERKAFPGMLTLSLWSQSFPAPLNVILHCNPVSRCFLEIRHICSQLSLALSLPECQVHLLRYVRHPSISHCPDQEFPSSEDDNQPRLVQSPRFFSLLRLFRPVIQLTHTPS